MAELSHIRVPRNSLATVGAHDSTFVQVCPCSISYVTVQDPIQAQQMRVNEQRVIVGDLKSKARFSRPVWAVEVDAVFKVVIIGGRPLLSNQASPGTQSESVADLLQGDRPRM